MTDTLPIAVVMGTINEAPNLRSLLPRLQGMVQEMVVVDDGSTDDSREVCAHFGAKVITRPWRMGPGTVVYAGVAASRAPFVATMDADGSHPPEALWDTAICFQSGASVVRFSRFLPGSAWEASWGRTVVVRAYGLLFNLLNHTGLSDPTNGFLVARRECFNGPTRFTEDSGEGWVAEFWARNRKLKTIELPYVHAQRLQGTSRFGIRRELQRAIRSLILAKSNPSGARCSRAR